MMNIGLIVGTRPNFMKAIPVFQSLKKYVKSENLFLIHTGQHYSDELSTIFLQEFNINDNEIYFLEKYSFTPFPKTSQNNAFYWMSTNLSLFFLEKKINKIIVFGDVNSTFAATIAGYINKLYIIHIESGLRSYDITMPEERNRVMIDRMSNMLFTTELTANDNLNKEGITENIYYCGNTMIDTLLKYVDTFKNSNYYKTLGLEKLNYVIMTIHREENVENEDNLRKIIETVSKLKVKILFITHPRTLNKITNLDITNLIVLNSQSYLKMLNLVYNSGMVLTDSGGLQEESTYLGIPCITLRNNTERPITLSNECNHIISPSSDNFENNFTNTFNTFFSKKIDNSEIIKVMGTGNASDKITEIIFNHLS